MDDTQVEHPKAIFSPKAAGVWSVCGSADTEQAGTGMLRELTMCSRRLRRYQVYFMFSGSVARGIQL